MDRCKKIAIIGRFGGDQILLDGQTVKTLILYQELSNRTDWSIRKVDTYYTKLNPIRLLGQSILALLTTKDVIVITSQNGRRVFFPLLYFFTKVFHTRVYHDVIGAKLAEFAVQYPAFVKYMNAFQVNWVETDSLKQDLEALGVTNAEVLPNFKHLDIVAPTEAEKVQSAPYKLCTFSRVMYEKGIEDAINAVKSVNERMGKTLFTLDIYGPVDAMQVAWFEKLKVSFPDFVSYKGAVHYQDSVNTLKNYFALVFPTRYYTEGAPGTIIDAYAAGVPVIASRWRGFSDVIDEGVTGLGYTFSEEEALTELLFRIAQAPDMVAGLVENCIRKASYYQPDISMTRLIDRIAQA